MKWVGVAFTALLLGGCWYSSNRTFGYLGSDWVFEVDCGVIAFEWNVDPLWIFGEGWSEWGPDGDYFSFLPTWGKPWYATWDNRRHVAVPLPFLIFASLIITGTLFLIDHVGVRIRRERLRAGACVHCGYNLTGNTSGQCPECGNRVGPAI